MCLWKHMQFMKKCSNVQGKICPALTIDGIWGWIIRDEKMWNVPLIYNYQSPNIDCP